MKKFSFKVSFLSKPSKEITTESNSVITAMNMVLNTLSNNDKEDVISVKVINVGQFTLKIYKFCLCLIKSSHTIYV